jgi:hypothetical protein
MLKEINHLACLQVWSSDCPPIGMDYEKMKALMETSREKSAAQRKPQIKEFPKPDSESDWTYLGYDLTKERIAA